MKNWSVFLALAGAVVPSTGLQVQPALLAPCTAIRRCAPPRALHFDDNENRIDMDDSDDSDECVITNVGASCFDTDAAGATSFNGFDEPRVSPPQNEEERRRRSPGMVSDFSAKSNDDFKKSYGSPTEAEKILDEDLVQSLRSELESQKDQAMSEVDVSPSEAAPMTARTSRVPIALKRQSPKAIGSTFGMDTPHHVRVPTMRSAHGTDRFRNVPIALKRQSPKAIGSTFGMDTPHHVRVPSAHT